jgi:glycosyltransferase involved in cell wall biosynthesis
LRAQVTGHNGYIGSLPAVAAEQADHEVVAPDSKPLRPLRLRPRRARGHGRRPFAKTLRTRVRRTARQTIRRIEDERALRVRRPPVLQLGTSSTSPTIFYLCPDYPVPSGGIRTIYRHVDILNDGGWRSAVLHHQDGYACGWFEHSTRTVGAPSVKLSSDDLLVVPEIYGPFLERLPRELRLVGFNQNAYLTFEHLPASRSLSYDTFEALLTVSQNSADYLRFAFPGRRVSVVDGAIDPAVFYPAPQIPAKRIAMMPRKRPDDAMHVLRLLGDRLRDWEVVTIESASERETAALLRSSPIFLAFGRQEGFGLPAAEAMATGCYVIGFPGFGGREIFDPSYSEPIEDGDVLSMARAAAEWLARYEQDPMAVREAGARASEHIRARYSLERLRAELIAFYEDLL